MATRKPLVLISGGTSELPPGDTVEGVVLSTTLTAGSGLLGGGLLATNQRIDVGIASNPSGLILVGNNLGIDGAAQRTADQALVSGAVALASGNAALTILASGVTKVAPNVVTTASISGGQVTTAKIADGAVTSAKLDSSLSNLLNPDLFIDLL
jgi:hypothetical protein